MKNKYIKVALAATLFVAASASASVINFTGGNVVRNTGTNETTNGIVNWNNVDYYEQNGFRLDFVSTIFDGTAGGSTNIGDYYGVGNDVIHAHWDAGNFGGVTSIEITKIGGGTFDLNYFVLTSNTYSGGQPASGLEEAWIEGFVGATSTGAQMLPPDDWGFPSTQIFVGSNFDAVDKVTFYATSAVDCFGMDEFYIDQAAPSPVPEVTSSFTMLGLITSGLLLRRRAKHLR